MIFLCIHYTTHKSKKDEQIVNNNSFDRTHSIEIASAMFGGLFRGTRGFPLDPKNITATPWNLQIEIDLAVHFYSKLTNNKKAWKL